MKYIITDQNEARTGGAYHQDMAQDCNGRVIRAGHCKKNQDGTYSVWGESFGYGISAKPEDADILEDIDRLPHKTKIRRLRIWQGICWVFITAILIYETYIHTL